MNEIDLRWKNIGNEELKDLCQIKFKELKKLYLGGNNISDIKVLEKVKFDKLEILDLGNNQILKKDNNSIISKLKIKIKKFYI